jgi:nucleotide-binding universal stress UspA family protein
MAPFKKILVPIDFSSHSERAAALAAQLAHTFDASVTLLHVYAVPKYPLPDGYVLTSPAATSQIMEGMSNVLRDAKERAAAKGAPRVDALLVEGAAFAEIVRTAREKQHDLIVMGTHGRTGLQHALMGSVAEKVVRKAHCPVLTVRDPEPRFEGP